MSDTIPEIITKIIDEVIRNESKHLLAQARNHLFMYDGNDNADWRIGME